MSSNANRACIVGFAVISVGLIGNGTSAQVDLPVFSGETVLHAKGSAVGRFLLPQDDMIIGFDLSTTSERAAALVSGPFTSSWLFKSGSRFVGLGHSWPAEWMEEGLHYVYLLADPGEEVDLRIDFRDLEGQSEFRLFEAVEGRFAPLEPSPLPPVGGTGYVRFRGAQPFEGPAFTGFFLFERQISDTVLARELRWATPEGIVRCDGWISYFGTGLGYGTTLIAAADYGGRNPVSLDYYRAGAGVLTEQVAEGLWIQRAADDPYPQDFGPVLVPPLWETVAGNEVLDQDAACAQATAGLILGEVGVNLVVNSSSR